MKKLFVTMLTISLLCYSCAMKVDKASIEKWKREIVDTEQNFVEMAKIVGLEKAFLNYAADDAVLMRNDKLIIGKNAIENYLKQPSNFKDISLLWKPDFVDVAASGDLGYTYGKYTFSYIDETGKKIESDGVFHTVWKRDYEGNWKFVWD